MRKGYVEITFEKAIEVWNDIAIFAYDEDLEVDWQINSDTETRGAYEVVQECKDNFNVLFVE